MITIKDEHILLDQTYNNAEAAIVAAGEFLVGHGLVSPPYIDSMLARQRKVSVYVGNFVALPHGDGEGQPYIEKEGICLIQVPDGVNFGSSIEGKTIGSFAGHRFFLLGYRKRDGVERCQRSAGDPEYSPKQLTGTSKYQCKKQTTSPPVECCLLFLCAC